MRNLLLLLFIPIAITLNSCSSLGGTTAWSGNWIEKEIKPSQIVKNGDVFAEYKLSNGRTCSVFADATIDSDARFYHTMLWQDFGWTLKNDKTWTAPSSARERKLGHIYINIKRGAAVYYYPDRNYSAFKVQVNPKEDN